jgi:hypothetical protein
MHTRLILAGLLMAQLGDAISFAIGVHANGIGAESNTVMALAYQAGGVGGVLLLKGFAILATLAILVFSATRFPKLVVLGGATATSLGLLGLLLNSVSIAIAHG